MDQFLKSKFKSGKKLKEDQFSLTYNGTTLSGEKPVIIKIYKRGTLNSGLIKVMKQKVKLLQETIHPKIVPLLDGDYGWQGFYYVRPFLQGETVKERTAREKFSIDEAQDILIEVCDAISAAHKMGIVHGALHSNNIFLTKDGIKIVDFIIEGDVKESQPQKSISILENDEIMSPEEILGSSAKPSSDIFACGILLYKMICGKSPFTTQQDKLRSNVELSPLIPRYLMDIIKKALEKDPLLRFKSIGELKESLKIKTVFEEKPQINIPNVELENTPLPKERERQIIKKEREKSFYLAVLVAASAIAGIIYAVASSIISRQ